VQVKWSNYVSHLK